jgi:enamine deaminase RidA (YjgF/YER057c/UK114 family)
MYDSTTHGDGLANTKKGNSEYKTLTLSGGGIMRIQHYVIIGLLSIIVLLLGLDQLKTSDMTKIENVNPESINGDFRHLYSHGKKVSNPESLLYISGQIGMNKDGSLGKDCSEQLDIAWTNVDAILTDAGMSKSNIVEVFVFVNGAPQHDVERNKALYAESVVNYFGENVPAMSALVSAGLWTNDLCFEVKLTAAK